VRRLLIQFVLPLIFAVLPLLAAGLIAAALPPEAVKFYLSSLTPLDCFILGLGGSLFAVQSLLSFRAMRWRGDSFDEGADPWLNRLSQSSEWFPLLGLIGTVAAIMLTFSSVTDKMEPVEIIRKYAPALTATGSGLFMALVNIFPAWMVLIGRGLILNLGQTPPPEDEEEGQPS